MTTRRLATVLFTDIVGSTDRLAELGDVGWGELLDRHRRMVRAQIEHFGGREVTTTGDGFLVLFDEPGPAIRCAVAVRDAARPLGIAVRTPRPRPSSSRATTTGWSFGARPTR